MRIHATITTEVAVFYHEIEGLRFKPQRGTDREGEFHRLLAKATLTDEGEIGSVWITGTGHYVKKDGTTGLADARIRFGSMSTLPEDWQQRITADLSALAAKVTVDRDEMVAV